MGICSIHISQMKSGPRKINQIAQIIHLGSEKKNKTFFPLFLILSFLGLSNGLDLGGEKDGMQKTEKFLYNLPAVQRDMVVVTLLFANESSHFHNRHVGGHVLILIILSLPKVFFKQPHFSNHYQTLQHIAENLFR